MHRACVCFGEFCSNRHFLVLLHVGRCYHQVLCKDLNAGACVPYSNVGIFANTECFFTIVVLIAFYSRTTCSRLSLYHVCCCRCSRFCAVPWYTCGRGTDVFVDLCHHHLQICVCVISGRGSRRFTGGFVLQLHLHNSGSMEATRDPFQSVSENDDDGELTSRRMRLFPDCGRHTCVLPCLCVMGMIFSTVMWLILFFDSFLGPYFLGGTAGAVIFLRRGDRQHFFHGVHAVRVCLPEATSMLAARLAARGSARPYWLRSWRSCCSS